MAFIALNFSVLFATQFLYGGRSGLELSAGGKNMVLATFIVIMLLMTK